MAERICPACSAVVPPRLKFCRECGGRVEDAPAEAEPPTSGDAGDATMVSSLPRKPSAAATARVPEEKSGDKTMIGAFTVRSAEVEPVTMAPAPAPEPEALTMAPDLGPEPATMAPSAEPEALTMAPDVGPEPATMAPAPEKDLNKTMVPPPEVVEAPSAPVPTGEETILGALPTPAPAAPPPPPARSAPTAVEAAEPDMAPITDDFDEEPPTSPTIPPPAVAVVPVPVPAPTPPPPPPAPPPPPPPVPAPAAAPGAPAPGGAIRLEHWSPKVKTATVTLTKAETLVGRDRGDLKYPEDNYLSKKHARFFHDASGRLCVEDLGAINGTYLRLRGPVKLEHRDVLYIGRHVFRFELLQYEDQDDRTIEGDPLTKVQGVQGKAPRARLVKRQAEGFRGLPFFFGTQRYVLGRTDGTHNFQKDDLMSRRHAALEFKEGDYWLEDLGSQNGTFLRLRGPRVLEPGDVVLMGEQYFKLP